MAVGSTAVDRLSCRQQCLHGTPVRAMMGQYGISSHQLIDGDHAMGERPYHYRDEMCPSGWAQHSNF